MKKIYAFLSALLLCMLFMPELRAQVDVQGAPSNRLRLIATSGSASINYSYSGLPWRVSNFDNPARTLIGLGPLPNTPPDSIVHAGSYYWQITNTGLANVTVSLSVPYLIGYDSPNDPDRLGITNGLDPLTASAGDLRPYLRWLVRYQNLLSYNANLAWTAIGGTITNDSLVSVSFHPDGEFNRTRSW
ncbi:MAG: hypothetical protein HGB19_00405 [Chlorobiales bacterium]|nr:hypothetical protein [Chlorobiales bacterium]